MRTADFEFDLPPDLIAQSPAPERDRSRLMVLHRAAGTFEHKLFCDLPGCLQPGDVLVLNNSRVIPARLRGFNAQSGGQFEMLLLEENDINDWWALLRPGKRARIGTQIILRDPSGNAGDVRVTVIEKNDEGHRRLRFLEVGNITDVLHKFGEVPLPPYISRAGTDGMAADRERYQTVFAEPPGSIAAPTAGLHFTEPLLNQIRLRGVQVCFITLHVGLGTFAPVKTESISAHTMHAERYELSGETANLINAAKRSGHRVIAVGTTAVRVLETAALLAKNEPEGSEGNAVGRPKCGGVIPGKGKTQIFIYPPREFKIVDALLTNFHLPRSTLLMLISAFAAPGHTRGREMILSAYAEAVRQRYRFFSYGDAMLLV